MIHVRLLTDSDIDAVWRLEEECFADDPWSREMFEKELENPLSVFLIAEDEDARELVGYGGVWFMYDSANITNIAVKPDFRREGIGKYLLELLIKISRENKMNEITLEVRASNEAAKKLYESEGFDICGLRKRYYRNREDALIMTKELHD